MVGGGPALFVIAKDVKNNTITVGTEKELELYSKECTLTDWVGSVPEIGKLYGAKIRYRQDDQECICHCEEQGEERVQDPGLPHFADTPFAMTVQFNIPQRAITPGQICVIYEGDRVVGSGIF
jgi:tRNA-uridine 2-sulfurtransferase